MSQKAQSHNASPDTLAVPVKVQKHLLQQTPEAEINHQLGRIFDLESDMALVEALAARGARRFLNERHEPDSKEGRLQAYVHHLIAESHLLPRSRFIGRNETVGEFILRATNELFRKARHP